MEQWRDIPGCLGYQASDAGRIRSVDRHVRTVDKRGVERTRLCRSRVLSPGSCRGYLIVNLKPTIAVHNLVALAFLPPRPTPAHTVNHIDLDKTNCAKSNLEWATMQEQHDHWRAARGIA